MFRSPSSILTDGANDLLSIFTRFECVLCSKKEIHIGVGWKCMRASDKGDAREASFRGVAVPDVTRTYTSTHVRIVSDRDVFVAEMRILTLEVIFIIRCH